MKFEKKKFENFINKTLLILFIIKKSFNDIRLIKKIENSLILRDDLIIIVVLKKIIVIKNIEIHKEIENDNTIIKESFITTIVALKNAL